MVGAMMLPTTVPMARMHSVVTAGAAHRARRGPGSMAGYFAVWLGFAPVALLGDAGVHALVERVGLAARPERSWCSPGRSGWPGRSSSARSRTLPDRVPQPAWGSCCSTTAAARWPRGGSVRGTGCPAWAAAGR